MGSLPSHHRSRSNVRKDEVTIGDVPVLQARSESVGSESFVWRDDAAKSVSYAETNYRGKFKSDRRLFTWQVKWSDDWRLSNAAAAKDG